MISSPDFIVNSMDEQLIIENPELCEYLEYHNYLDKLCWITKFEYLSKDEIKRKNYRLDSLYQNFLFKNKFSCEKVKKIIASTVDNNLLDSTLLRGWFNGLSCFDLSNAEYLNIGTTIKNIRKKGSSDFANWSITKNYYAFYEYMNFMLSCLDNHIDSRGHKNLIKVFNNNSLGKMKKTNHFLSIYNYQLFGNNISR